MSDIHGHYTLLKEALDQAGFEKNNDEHLLICCCDCFDRGNHEDMLMEIMEKCCLKEHNFWNGTVQTIEDFFGKNVLDYGSFNLDFSGKTRTH